MSRKLRLAFDIDGTICTNTNGRYYDAKPFKEMIDYINEMHEAGHYIIFHTARGMGRHNSVPGKAFTSLYKFTQEQLDGWGVQYDELHLGKIHVDLFVDDKGFRVNEDGSSAEDLRTFIREGFVLEDNNA